MTVLILLQIFSLLGLVCMQNITISIKMRSEIWEQEIFSMKGMQILRELEAHLLEEAPACVKPDASAEFFTACHGNFHEIRYDYAIELLGLDLCGFILKDNDNQMLAPYYYRITLLASTHKQRLKWQTVIALPSSELPHCTNPHRVIPGRQMWREI